MSTTDKTVPAPPPSRLLFLPEIIDVLRTSLYRRDIFQCLQVCRAWYNLFTPYMYHYHSDHRHSWSKILGKFCLPKDTLEDKDETWLLEVFAKHGRHVRQLQAHWCVTLNAIAAAQTCTHLEALSVEGQKWDRTRPEMTNSVVWRPPGLSVPSDEESLRTFEQHQRILGRWLCVLVRQNARTLTSLRVDSLAELEVVEPGVLEGFLRGCQKLNRLFISGAKLGDTKNINIPKLVEDVPQIEDFSVRWNETLLRASLPNLKTLRLKHAPIQAVFQLLKSMPHLQELYIQWGNGDHQYHDALGAILDNTPSKLQRLHISRIGFLNDDYFARDVLPWLPDLVHISTQHIGPTLAAFISTNYRNLRSYKQPNPVKSICPKYSLPHSTINTLGVLMENCPHLTEFDGIEHKIEADYLLDHPWVCKGLEVLRCQIVGVHRLTEEEDVNYRQGKLFLKINNKLVEKEKQAIKKLECLQVQQQRVYDRLAEMVHLRVLDLGMEYRVIEEPQRLPQIRYGVNEYADYGGPIPDTLELSMESGLDRLSTLKELEVFGFEGVDHRIDCKELQWMGRSWPRLKEMRGLQEVKLERMRPDETSYLRGYMKRMYPHVKHKRK